MEYLSSLVLKIGLTHCSKQVINYLKENWLLDLSAFNYAKKKMRVTYENKIIQPGVDFDNGIINLFSISKTDFDSIEVTTEYFNLRTHLQLLLKERTKDWTVNRNENILDNMIDDFIDFVFEYHIKEGNKVGFRLIYSKLEEIIHNQNSSKQLKILEPLISYLEYHSGNDYLNNLLENNLTFFTDEDNAIIEKLYNIFINAGSNRIALLSGEPDSGKTILAYHLGIKLEENKNKVYILRIGENTDLYRIWDDLDVLDDNSIVIFENCHVRLDLVSDLVQTLYRKPNLSFLFISRNLSSKFRKIDEYSDFDFFEYFQNNYFEISQNNFHEKANGIINKYKSFQESVTCKNLSIGNLQIVINNSQNSLLTLQYILSLWEGNVPLDKVDKNVVLKKLYDRFFKNDEEVQFILKIACLSKYEIYLDVTEKDIVPASNLCKKGIVKNEENSNYYYLFHSSFANLLINAFSIHTEYKKYSNKEDFICNRIKNYILSFEKYPQNIDNIFYYLNTNHGLMIASDLLRDENIAERFSEFHSSHRINLRLFLLLLYRLIELDSVLTEKFSNDISDDIWRKNLLEMSLPSLSICLYHLFKINPVKAISVINTIQLSAWKTKVIETSEFHLITNSIRELEKISGNEKLGKKVIELIESEIWINKITTSSLIHLSKGISEIHAISPSIAKEIIRNISPNLIRKLISESSIKAFSKSLNEIKKVDENLSYIILTNTPQEEILNQFDKLKIEGISRSLNEFSKIDKEIAKELFNKIAEDKIVYLLLDSDIEQIGHSISEFNSIDKNDELHRKKLNDIFFHLPNDKLRTLIHKKSASFNKIGTSLGILLDYDFNGYKIQTLIDTFDNQNILSKAKQEKFHELILGLEGINKCSNKYAQFILTQLGSKHLITKANNNKLEHIGSDLNRLSTINKEFCNSISNEIDWNRIINRCKKNIQFSNLADSVCALFSYNKSLAQQLLNKFDLSYLINRASMLEKNNLLKSLNKLNVVSKETTKEIVKGLKKIGYIKKSRKDT